MLKIEKAKLKYEPDIVKIIEFLGVQNDEIYYYFPDTLNKPYSNFYIEQYIYMNIFL